MFFFTFTYSLMIFTWFLLVHFSLKEIKYFIKVLLTTIIHMHHIIIPVIGIIYISYFTKIYDNMIHVHQIKKLAITSKSKHPIVPWSISHYVGGQSLVCPVSVSVCNRKRFKGQWTRLLELSIKEWSTVQLILTNNNNILCILWTTY